MASSANLTEVLRDTSIVVVTKYSSQSLKSSSSQAFTLRCEECDIIFMVLTYVKMSIRMWCAVGVVIAKKEVGFPLFFT